MSRETEQLVMAQNTAMILYANLPEEYVSTSESDRRVIAAMYERLHGKPVTVADEPTKPCGICETLIPAAQKSRYCAGCRAG